MQASDRQPQRRHAEPQCAAEGSSGLDGLYITGARHSEGSGAGGVGSEPAGSHTDDSLADLAVGRSSNAGQASEAAPANTLLQFVLRHEQDVLMQASSVLRCVEDYVREALEAELGRDNLRCDRSQSDSNTPCHRRACCRLDFYEKAGVEIATERRLLTWPPFKKVEPATDQYVLLGRVLAEILPVQVDCARVPPHFPDWHEDARVTVSFAFYAPQHATVQGALERLAAVPLIREAAEGRRVAARGRRTAAAFYPHAPIARKRCSAPARVQLYDRAYASATYASAPAP